MQSEDAHQIAGLTVSDESRRTIEASLAAGTSGRGFIVLLSSLTTLAVLLLVGALGVAAFAGGSALGGDPAAWRLAVFSLLFASPIALFLAVQIPFLVRLGRGG